jgi:hypothetical protein
MKDKVMIALEAVAFTLSLIVLYILIESIVFGYYKSL